MKKYFRLNPYCYFVRGEKEGCVYNLLNGKMTIIYNDKKCEIIELCEKNVVLQSISNIDYAFLDKLQQLDIGMYYDKPLYIDKVSVGLPQPIEKSLSSNSKILNLSIELDNACNFDCNFCILNDNTLYRRTGCKRWRLDGNLLNMNEWKCVIDQVSCLSCEHIVFYGGEPLLKLSQIQELCQYISEQRIKKISIYTNGSILDDDIVQLINKYSIKLHIQILGGSNLVYEKITGVSNLFDRVYNNVKRLINEGIDFDILFLVTRDNDMEIEIAYEKYSKIIQSNKIKFDYIYPIPENDFYSKKYSGMLYNKKESFCTSRLNISSFCDAQKQHNCYSNQIAITATGDVLPCIMSRSFVLGNIRKENIATILRTDNYETLKNLNKDKIEKCKTCALKYGCFDCRALEYSATGNLYGIEFCDRVDGF